MDFMNRNMRPAPTNTQGSAGTNTASPTHHHSRFDSTRKTRIFSVVLLFSITVLLLALSLSFFLRPSSTESRFVDKAKLQAVFINGGQVYFGRIGSLNERFLSMSDIYYLRVNQQVQPDQNNATKQDISLVKLGCELHGPTDEMVINREQVTFWENLKDDGQVAKAVAEYKKQNPEGQKCNTPSTTNNQSDTSN
jgi:hypothetical protein